jgi:hypothetical protein
MKYITFNVVKSILYGLAFPMIYFWLTIFDPKFINPIIDEYRLISQEKITTTGLITNAVWFEDDVEISDSKSQHITGYEYDYTFSSNKGEIISGTKVSFKNLPFNIKNSQLPFNIKIEYLENEPKLNKIQGLSTNYENLWDLFRRKLFIHSLLLTFCCYFAYRIIKNGITESRLTIKNNL